MQHFWNARTFFTNSQHLELSPFHHDFIQSASSILTSSSFLDTLNPPEVTTLTIAEGICDATLFQGKTMSMLHPVMMFGMLGLSLSTALLGFQWRRQRTLGDEIRILQASLPPIKPSKSSEDTEGSDAVAAVAVEVTQQAATIQSQIDALISERKQLASEGPRDKHFSQGATLAFLGTLFAIEVRDIHLIP